MADTTKGNGWKTLGIIASILAGIWVLVSLITGRWNPRRWFTPKDEPAPADGTACTTADNSAGHYEGGNCIKNTGLPDDSNPVTRTGNGNGNLPDDSAVSQLNISKSSSAPPTIIVPFNTPVPYSYLGCTYGKPVTRVQYQGQWMMQLTKVSCP